MDARALPHVGFDPNKIRTLIAKYLGIDVEQVTDEAHFRNDFDLDSLDQLELRKNSPALNFRTTPWSRSNSSVT
jgi:hypothetical protein